MEKGARITKRVADEAVLRLYLERVEGTDISVLKAAEYALGLLNDTDAFEQYLRSNHVMINEIVFNLLTGENN